MDTRPLLRPFARFAWMLLLACAASAEVRLPALISDHMVLQRDAKVRLWGAADPGETVGVRGSWSEATASAVADAAGRWRVELATPAAGGPHTLTFTASNTLVVGDVLVGEVWVGSGQSNMEMPLGNVAAWYTGVQDAEAEIARAEHPTLRFFTVENRIALAPEDDCKGAWVACTPETARTFSATAYFFGRELARELKVPIGLVAADWGGTPAEAWTSAAGLAGISEYAAGAARVAQLRADARSPEAAHRSAMQAWWRELEARDPGSAAGAWAAPAFDDSKWTAIELPATFAGALADFDGVVWYRRAVEIPAALAGRELALELGPIDDMDTAYFDGVRVGGMEDAGAWQTARTYRVPEQLAGPGRRVIAVRVVDTGGAGGFTGAAAALRLAPSDGGAAGAIPLAGAWKCAPGARAANLPPLPQDVFDANTPTVLFNGMIAPLLPLTIRGVIWYQGESNRYAPELYARLFPALIRDWRTQWGIGEFPFLFVQIAPFEYGDRPGATAAVREAQRATLALPRTGMVVTLDLGDARDIHPKNKQEVGRRLAAWALSLTYGRADVAASGPRLHAARVERSAVVLEFECAGGLVARGELAGFEVAGADGRFVPARAAIEGRFVRVWAESVSAPAGVRYAWSDMPGATLYDGSGLPASPFTATPARSGG